MAHSPVEPMTASHRIPSVPGPRRAPAATAAGSRAGRRAVWPFRGSEVMEPRGPRSILQVVARQPGRYWRRRSPQVLQLLHSSYVCDGGKRAELNDWLGHELGPSSGFPQRPCGRVRRKPKACTGAGSRSNPTVPDDRQTAQPRAERTSVEGPPEHHGDWFETVTRIGCAQNSGHSSNGSARRSNP